MPDSIVIRRPDDWHLHLRDGPILKDTVDASSNHFARALVMPNLKPALTSLDALLAYHQRILAEIPHSRKFTPFVTFYLNEELSPEDLEKAKDYPFILGAKLYPAGVTTNSSQGVKTLKALYPLFELMQEKNLVLQIHGEVPGADIFQREALFLQQDLSPLIKNFPRLRIVLEHISSQAAVDFVLSGPPTLAASITPQHLLYNRNHLLDQGLKPHYYCLPILKKKSDQLALQEAAISKNPKFFAGTDSAPHPSKQKESACGCAGIYSAPYALPLYTQVFAELQALDKLEAFLSIYGANFYQLPLNEDFLTLVKKTSSIPEKLPLGQDWVVPIAAGQDLSWSVYVSA